MKKICFVTASPSTARTFLRDHMAALKKEYKVYYISNQPDEDRIEVAHDEYHCVNINRKISLIKDVKALFALLMYFKHERFDAVHSVTPKAGLLTALAAYIARVPVRIHIFTGQTWANQKGVFRWLLKSMDKCIVRFDNHILVDGNGQRQFLIQEGVLREDNSLVLGEGSICGVNTERFSPSIETRTSTRKELNITDSQVVFVFMGRLNHDKGLYELLQAFDKLAIQYPEAFLLLIGGDEENIAEHFRDYIHLQPGKNFMYYGRTKEPERMLQAGDVFVLPTYREGFGSSIIEASALGLPVICSDAYGVKDAMVDDVTGLRCKVGDVESLFKAMQRMIDSPSLRFRLGLAGKERVVREFDGKVMTQHWIDYYHVLLYSGNV